MSENEIILKAFGIMAKRREKSQDVCREFDLCKGCPFQGWYICPNQIQEYEEDDNY